MPPKNRNKAGKAKTTAVVDALSTEEMAKDQLEEQIIRLREELGREREERSYFQLERDKIHSIWEMSKRKLEETEAKLRNSIQQKDEAEERHSVEITVYKQKLKHVLSEQHNATSKVKVDATTASSLLQNRNSEAEVELRREFQELQTGSRQKQIQGYNAIKKLKLQAELMKLSNEYERRMHEMETKFQQRMWSLMEMEEKKRKSAVNEVEEQMSIRVESLIETHDRILQRGEENLSQVHENRQEEMTRWKEELKKLQNQKLEWEKETSAAQEENRRLKETLQEVQQKLPELQRRLKEHQNSKDQMERYRAQQKRVSQELLDRMVEHELLQQAFQQVQQERDELLRRQTESVLDIQQRSSLKKILLQKKLEVLTETLETKEAQLSAALEVCSTEPAARSHAVNRLQEILESKRTTMEALQQDLDQESQEYQELLHSQEQPPETHRVSPLDLPFRAAEQTLEEAGSEPQGLEQIRLSHDFNLLK
ncbi:dynein regulatory complex subunit 4-like isoform 2-T2 [Anableps anableps]